MAIDLKKIKSLFVETSEEQKSQPETVSYNPDVSNVKENNTHVNTGSFDQKIFDSLLKAIEDHNLPGEDYLEFLIALKAMENIPLDEKMKVQTVLATLSTKGLTPQKIKESADYYKKVLLDEQKQFYSELGKQIDAQLKSKELGITDLQKQNTKKTEEISRLTQEINANQQKITEFQLQIKEAEAKIKTAEGNFIKTYEYVVNQIDSNINKINN